MTTTPEPKVVTIQETSHVTPSEPVEGQEEEYLPLAPASGGTETPPAASTGETTPPVTPPATPTAEVQPAAPAAEPPVASATPAAAPAVVPAQDDAAILGQGIKNLSTEYKRLDNETPVEYARRLEIIRLRKKVQGDRAAELLGGDKQPPVGAPAAVTPPVPSEKDDIDPEEVQRFAKIAAKAGYVPKAQADAQVYNQGLQSAFDSWIQNTPELSVENDPDGAVWDVIKKEFQSGLYNMRPKNPADLSKILDNIKRDVLGIQPTSGLNKIQAQQAKINVASHSGASPGGGAPAAPNPANSTKEALLKRGLKGFTDEEIAEMAKD